MPVFISKVYAEPTDLVNQLQKEARQFTVTNAILNCIYDKNGSGIKEYVETEELSSSMPIFKPNNAYVGTHVKPSDGAGDCGNENWVADAVDMLGFKTHTDFMNIFYDQIEGTNKWELKTKYAIDSDGDALKDFLKALDGTGSDAVTCPSRSSCIVNQLSDGARYQLMLTNFARGCGATKVTGGEDEIKTIAPDRLVTIKTVDETGAIKDTPFKLSTDKVTSVVVGAGVTDDGKYRCETIVKQINQYAPAFAEKVKQAVENNQPVGDVNSALTPPVVSARDACQKNTGLIAGWIICDGMELLSKGMDAVMDQVDNMLNVDFSLLNTKSGDGLKNAWNVFRIMANFMLFAVAVVMIISQAMGGGS